MEIVIVIDFGTSNTGCLFEYYREGKRAEGYLLDRMPANRPDYAKQPTFLLIKRDELKKLYNDDKKLQLDRINLKNGNILIGCEAEEFLLDIEEKGESDKWIAFDKIKMNLYNPNCNEVVSSDGEKYNLIDIIAIYIKVLKEKCMNYLSSKCHTYSDNQVQWVVTIPAVWDNIAKKKMEMVNRMVFDKDISKVLEPEGAAVHICFQKSMEMQVGKKFLVVDCGGGTTDIVGLTIKQDFHGKTYTEECLQSGIPTAGTNIDDDFWRFFAELLCENTSWKEDMPSAEKYNKLVRDCFCKEPRIKLLMKRYWFNIKHTFDTMLESGILKTDVPEDYKAWLWEKYPEIYQKNIKGIKFQLDIERKKLIDKVFVPTVDKIANVTLEAIHKLEKEGNNFDYVFLTGGTSSIGILSTKLRKEIGINKLYYADECSNSRFPRGGTILYGAAYMHINDILLLRKSKLYYYITLAHELPNKSIDDMLELLKGEYFMSDYAARQLLDSERQYFEPFYENGKWWCDFLRPICRKDEMYSPYEGYARPIDINQKKIKFNVWSSVDRTFLPGCIKDRIAPSSKVHHEGCIEFDCKKEKDFYYTVDFNEVPRNSYFIIQFRNSKTGPILNSLKVERVESIVGH